MKVCVSKHEKFAAIWDKKVSVYNKLASTLNDEQIELLLLLVRSLFEIEQLACDIAYTEGLNEGIRAQQ